MEYVFDGNFQNEVFGKIINLGDVQWMTYGNKVKDVGRSLFKVKYMEYTYYR
jgi:hypothetical protein